MPDQIQKRKQHETIFTRQREPSLVDASARLFQPLSAEDQKIEDQKKNPKRNTYPPPRRPAIRGSLIERDNEDEFMEFHWNPTTYNVSKSAKWNEKGDVGGTPQLDWSGSGLTQVSFDLLLNDVGQPHRTDGTVEESLQWLFSRLRSRTEQQAKRKKGQGRINRDIPWLNQPNNKANKAPPILVLFGLSSPFTCVLTQVSVKTIYQGTLFNKPDKVRANTATAQLFQQLKHARVNTTVPDTRFGSSSTASKLEANKADKITRATVSITLKEYINAASTEGS